MQVVLLACLQLRYEMGHPARHCTDKNSDLAEPVSQILNSQFNHAVSTVHETAHISVNPDSSKCF